MQLYKTALDLLFNEARSQNGWLGQTVDEALLRQLYDLMKMGPTSLNCSPSRIVFATSPAAKQKLSEAVSPGNVEKVRTAPAVAIIGYDLDFPNYLPKLFPHNPQVAALFDSKPDFTRDTAFRNGSLQGAYLMIAARALGLDVGPMSGFDPAKVEEGFFPDGRVKVNFLCGLGYGDPSKVFGRSPRPSFDDVCRMI